MPGGPAGAECVSRAALAGADEPDSLCRLPVFGTDERSVTAVITGQGRALLEMVLPGHVEVVEQGMFDAWTTSRRTPRPTCSERSATGSAERCRSRN
ncbi:hypothetical protein ACWC9U_31750 [Streptomyces sp. 900116325]